MTRMKVMMLWMRMRPMGVNRPRYIARPGEMKQLGKTNQIRFSKITNLCHNYEHETGRIDVFIASVYLYVTSNFLFHQQNTYLRKAKQVL